MEGVTESEWAGKRVLSLNERQTFFYFSLSQNTSVNLQLKYHLGLIRQGKRLKFLINHSFLAEVSLRPSLINPNQISLTIPYYLPQGRENHLEILRSKTEPNPLYLESLTIRNYKGYSSGLFTAYILPLPLNPPSIIQNQLEYPSDSPFSLFIILYSLFGIVYGLSTFPSSPVPFYHCPWERGPWSSFRPRSFF